MEYVNTYDMIEEVMRAVGSDAVELFFTKDRSYEKKYQAVHTVQLDLEMDCVDLCKIGTINPITVHVEGDVYAKTVSQPYMVGKRVKHVAIDYELYTKAKKGA